MVVLLQELSQVLAEADKPDTGAVDHSSFVAGSFLAGSTDICVCGFRGCVVGG
jgi:hypothetical protein